MDGKIRQCPPAAGIWIENNTVRGGFVMKKRIGSGVLALCLLLALLPGNAWAAEGDTPVGGTDTFVEADSSVKLQELIAAKTANIKLTKDAYFASTSL